ncbi:TRAP transporter large permease [uncultured Oscillibacter sp.]|uniref:TRAP transporter large permease n=1 Tax=uncultured Oscillibacter sp. TaxID=876091 RepID=UPI0028061914|nr:TRAP transporter large permease [uncultured Oscillibacter sp.]
MTALLIMFLLFIVLLLSGLPIFAAIGLSSVSYILASGDVPLTLIPQKIFFTADSFSLLAIPLFMMAGELMNSGGITRSILDFCTKLVGHIRGGLAHISILACMIFAGMCGSCTAAAASVGSMMLPALHDDGYEDDFSGAVIASAAVLGPVIPPSIIMVIYASISGDSVAKLFMGGLVPGFLIGALLMAVAYFISVKRGYKAKNERMAPVGEIAKSLLHSLPALLLPVAIIVGIMSGVFTATEAGAIAVAYSFALGFLTRELKLKDLVGVLVRAAKSSANVLLLMGTGATLGWILTKNQVPQTMTKFLLGITENPALLMMIIIAFVLFLGCFLTDATIVPILTPLLLPVIQSIGYDSIAFGVILCTISVVGNLTPPVGGLLFVVSGVGHIPVGKIAVAVLPFLFTIVAALIFCAFFPAVISFLPSLLLT